MFQEFKKCKKAIVRAQTKMNQKETKRLGLLIKVFNILILVCALHVLISLSMAYQTRESISWSSLSIVGTLTSGLLVYVCILMRNALKRLLKE
jgi:hypothetical protein